MATGFGDRLCRERRARYDRAMPRCPNCRKPLAKPVGDCPHCGHDLDKYAWLLGSVGEGTARRSATGVGMALAAGLLIFLLVRIW
ncbi:MAG: hypothetical protein ABR601_09065 [Parasphingopyxis sp.]